MKRGDIACEGCFLPHHEELRAWIRERGNIGDCPWCGSRGVYVVPLSDLGEIFRPVAATYVEHDGHPFHEGMLDTISAHLQMDWDIFSDEIDLLAEPLTHDLTAAILEAGIRADEQSLYPDYRHSLFVTANFGARPTFTEIWHDRIIELLHGTGESPTGGAGGEAFQLMLERAARRLESGTILHRARAHNERDRHEPFTLGEMGAPPAGTRAGRANRKDEAVLYVASNRETALLEKRAWKHAVIAVAEIVTKRPLRILDLARPFYQLSPFFVEDLDWEVESADLLRRFARELSRPVLPEMEDRHYVPSQEVCHVLRESGYEGVMYPSEMGEGYNLVLFDPTAGEAVRLEYLVIQGVTLDTRLYGRKYIRVDDWPYDD